MVGGTARGRRLKGPPAGVRPTSELVRGVIFDTLAAQGVDISHVLDLYAGSGALGIEALSRGSERCDFVEQSSSGATVIRENLSLTGLGERGGVYRIAVARARQRLAGPYSLILADPPYDDETAPEILGQIAGSALIGEDGTLVWEHSSRRKPGECLGPLRLAWSRRHGDTEISMYRRPDRAGGEVEEETT